MTFPSSVPDDELPDEALQPVEPAYGSGSLADLLPSVSAVLGVPGAADVLGLRELLGDVDRVAVVLVDGLGAYQLPLMKTHAPGLDRLAARTLTSGFPSTTPVSLVTLGAGVPPGEHGVLGFTLLMPDGCVLNHIQWGDDPPPASWQPVPTRFELATAAGVRVTQVTRPEFQGTGLTVAANRGASFVGASSHVALATGMIGALRSGPGLVYGYHPDLDKAGHLFGVGSAEWQSAAADVGTLVDALVDGLPPRSALLVTADHGQFNVPAADRVDLSALDLPEVVAITGEPRVRYLHVKPCAASSVASRMRSLFGDRAWVLTRAEAIGSGLFGPVAPRHADRIGDVVVVCLGRTVALATAAEPPILGRMIAYHGSVTAAEMTIPLLSFVVGSG